MTGMDMRGASEREHLALPWPEGQGSVFHIRPMSSKTTRMISTRPRPPLG